MNKRGPLSAFQAYPHADEDETRPQRVALYSHDTVGLGHVRRNSLIAAALVAALPEVSVLLLTGAPEAAALPLPPRTDLVSLPALSKKGPGLYAPRSLSVPLEEIMAVRKAILMAALTSFAPDLFIVDKVARGVNGELEETLRRLRDAYGTSTVLGLRDVLDDPATTAREWAQGGTHKAIRTLYDRVWVYGDPHVYDPAVEYDWPRSVTRKVEYTGYLAHGRSTLLGGGANPVDFEAPFVLGLVGGGEDGAPLATAFTNALLPRGHRGVMICGPHMPKEAVDELVTRTRSRPELVVRTLVADVTAFVSRASATVSMGGYNSACELMATGRPALIVPRTVPRTEQAIRADRLCNAGLVEILRPADLTAERVGAWLATAVQRPQVPRLGVRLDGLANLPILGNRLLNRAVTSDRELRDVAI